MRRLALAFFLLGASPALAQGGPSFDCAKADNAIDRTICKEAELAKADREMVTAYTALLDRLSGAAREHLVKDQIGWIASRNRGCAIDPQGLASCLKGRYAVRTANLRSFADGPYPFISEQSLIRQGKLGNITWSYDIAYPRFDGTGADFAMVNTRFADAAKKSAEEATPKADAGPDRKQEWSYEQSFRVKRPPGGHAVTIALSFYGYSGGAHGYGATRCTLVDLRTGRALGPQGVFVPDEQWLRVMTQIVGSDLRKQFVDRPGFDDAIEPANLAKTLSEPAHYCWTAEKLLMVFNAYDVGPYAAGPYEVEIPYDRLKPILRGDGPIAR
jgi:uncharacterized protein YecT (DUF1311 family)